MASSLIRLPITTDVLYAGNKWTTGEKTLAYNYADYDYLVIKLRTNSEYFTRTLPVYHGLLSGNAEFIDLVVYDTVGSSGWLYCGLFLSGGTDSKMSVSTTYNNGNWVIGIIKIVGVKIN